jgi:hypothetical protein
MLYIFHFIHKDVIVDNYISLIDYYKCRFMGKININLLFSSNIVVVSIKYIDLV